MICGTFADSKKCGYPNNYWPTSVCQEFTGVSSVNLGSFSNATVINNGIILYYDNGQRTIDGILTINITLHCQPRVDDVILTTATSNRFSTNYLGVGYSRFACTI